MTYGTDKEIQRDGKVRFGGATGGGNTEWRGTELDQ
jgi:hypothetical protein